MEKADDGHNPRGKHGVTRPAMIVGALFAGAKRMSAAC
jgi:hypothetical protein